MAVNTKLTKDERRKLSQENARQRVVIQKRKAWQKKLGIQLGITAMTLGVIALAVVIVVASSKTASLANPKNMLSDGILITQGLKPTTTAAIKEGSEPTATTPNTDKVNVVVYFDYLCPYCKQFEDTNASQLESWLEDDLITVEYHPVAVLGEYSVRASNAMACVVNSEPEHFWAFHTALFANQPSESLAGGLKNTEIANLAEESGVNKTELESCMADKTFVNWVNSATDRATIGPLPNTELPNITGTPTVLVDGVKYTGNPLDAVSFKEFVEAAM
jgi:protein-disulfide isomerase